MTLKKIEGRTLRASLFITLLLVWASLARNAAASCYPPPPGLIDWWSGDGNANDIQGTNNGILAGGATATATGFVGKAFSFDGTNSYAQIPDAPALHPTNLTVETWVRFDSLDSAGSGAPAGDQYLVFKQNTRTGDFEGFDLSKRRVAGGDVFRFLISPASGSGVEIDSATLLSTGVWYHVAAVRGSNFTQIYVNGQLERQTNITFNQDYGALPLYFGTSGQPSWDRKLKGSLDEVSLYNRALSSNEIAAIYSAGAAGKCKAADALAITLQPASQNAAPGGNAIFAVAASGAGPLGYQWRFNGAAIVGATKTALALDNIQAGSVGSYTVVVTNPVTAITSAFAVLAVMNPPVVTLQPQNATRTAGSIATFGGACSGDAPLTCQWRLNGVNLANSARVSGATSPTLTIAGVQWSDAGAYTLEGINPVGTAISSPAVLTVLSPPVITTAPLSQCVATNHNALFQVTAAGSSPLGYQWQFNGASLPGATGMALMLNYVKYSNAGSYSVVVTNSMGAQTSPVAVLSVMNPPGIVAEPHSTSPMVGTTVTFNVGVSGSAPLCFQWRRNGVNLVNSLRVTGATNGALTITDVQSGDSGSYTCVATNPVGITISAPAVLTVLVPPAITAPPSGLSVNAGSNATFNVTATGSAPLTYQWLFNGTNLTDGGQFLGSGTPSLFIGAVQTNNAGSYSVIVANAAGSVTSALAALTVVTSGSCLPAPAGLVGWWTGDGNANDSVGPDNGSLQSGASISAAGLVGQAFSFDGVSSFVSIPDYTILRPTNFTVEAWVKFNSLDSSGSGAPAGDQYIVFKQNSRYDEFEGIDLSKTRKSGSDVFRFLVTSTTAQSVEIDSVTKLTTNLWYHVAAVRGSNYLQLYVNGQLEKQATVTFAQDYGTLPMYFGTSGLATWDRRLSGLLDEVSLYNRPLSSNEVAAVYNAGAGGKCKSGVGPTIFIQPASQVLLPGSNATFSASAVGTAPLAYQWQKDGFKLNNGGNISGANTSSLTVSNTQTGDIGNYQVTIINGFGSATSVVASLSTGVPPPNNAFGSAQAVSGSSGSVAGNNANATKQANEPNHAGNAGGASVWYTWTAPSTSPVTFDTALSAFDTLLAVYTGTAVGSLTLIASNDNATTNTTRSRLTFTPVAGTVYRIAVDGAGGVTGNFTLRWAQANVPLPDLVIVASAVNAALSTETFDPSSCAVVEGLIQPGTRRLIRFDTETENQGTEDLFFGDPSANPLFVWAPCHAHYHFNNYMAYRLRDANNNIAAIGLKVGFCVLDVFRWKSGSASTAYYNCGNQGIQVGWGDLYDRSLDGQWIDVTGLPDGNYTIEIEPNPQGIIQEANYNNNMVHVPFTIGNPNGAPANNNFANSQALLGTFASVSGTTANATKQANEPNHAGNAGGHSVWYYWQAVDTKPVTIDTLGSSFNTLLGVYTGSSLTSLQLVASNDDIGPGVIQSKVTFNAQAGVVYQIAVDGYNGASGNLVLTLNQTIENDNFANPEFIGGVSGIAHGANTGATKEPGEPDHAGNAGGASIWYAWTAPINGTATFDTLGSTFNTLLAAYTGGAVNLLTPVASNDNIDPLGGVLQSRISFNAVGLSRYYIAIDGFNGATGDTTLNWSFQAGSSSHVSQQPFPVRASVINTFLPNGEFQLLITGQPDQRYLIERSCDLEHWTSIVTTLADDSGAASFVDKSTMHLDRQSASGDPICGPGQLAGASFSPGTMRFYRATAIGVGFSQ